MNFAWCRRAYSSVLNVPMLPTWSVSNTVDDVVDRAGWGCEVKDISNRTAIKFAANISLEEFEVRLVRKMCNVFAPPGQQIVERNHPVALAEQSITKMRAEKSGASCYQNAHRLLHLPGRAVTIFSDSSPWRVGCTSGRPML